MTSIRSEEDVEGGLASQFLVSGGQRGVAGVEAVGAGGRW